MNILGGQVSERTIHRIFEVGVILKGLHSLLEIVGGLILLAVSTDTIVGLAEMLTRAELIEDPHDAIASFLLSTAQQFSLDEKSFAAFFLLSHGVVKLVLVAAILRNKKWGYPAFMIALTFLILYQSYRMMGAGFSPGLAAVTVFDAIMLGLTWHEYKLRDRTRELRSQPLNQLIRQRDRES